MDINEVITLVKMEIGIGDYLKTTVTDKAMSDYIAIRTLNTFSSYFPNRITFDEITYGDLNKVRPGVYKLPNRCGRVLKNMGVKVYGIYELITQPGGYFGGTAQYPQQGGGMGGLPFIMAPFHGYGDDAIMGGHDLSGLANTHYSLGMQRRKLTAYWHEPDEIEIRAELTDLALMCMGLTLNISHDKNLSTINPAYEEAFMELCKIDIMNLIYVQELQHVNDLDVGYGRVVIDNMDMFRTASERRKELLEKWDELYLNDCSQMNTMI
ncbi:MAG: hypothetical protein ACRC92_26080 [Peptostreptococcaceae bacterium]